MAPKIDGEQMQLQLDRCRSPTHIDKRISTMSGGATCLLSGRASVRPDTSAEEADFCSTTFQTKTAEPIKFTGDAADAWAAIGGNEDGPGGVTVKQLHKCLAEVEVRYRVEASRNLQRRRSSIQQQNEEDEAREVTLTEFSDLVRAPEAKGGRTEDLSVDDIYGREPSPPPPEWRPPTRPFVSTRATIPHLSSAGQRRGRGQARSMSEGKAPESGRREVNPAFDRLRISAMRGKGRRRHIHPDESLSAAERVKEAATHNRMHEELMRMFAPEVRLALSAASARRAIGGPSAEERWFSKNDARRDSRRRLYPQVGNIMTSINISANISSQNLTEEDAEVDATLPYRGLSPSRFLRTGDDPAAIPLAESPVARVRESPRRVSRKQFSETPTPLAIAEAAVAKHGPVVARLESLPDPYAAVERFLVKKATAREAEARVKEGTFQPELATLHLSAAAAYNVPAIRPRLEAPKWRRSSPVRKKQPKKGWIGLAAGLRSGMAPLNSPSPAGLARSVASEATPGHATSAPRVLLQSIGGRGGRTLPVWNSGSFPHPRAASAEPRSLVSASPGLSPVRRRLELPPED
eukprot:Hpha_TRINITY_DN14971_c5_g6::TRINITY_DN14971_c5_g6_i1::g.143963::m.143963